MRPMALIFAFACAAASTAAGAAPSNPANLVFQVTRNGTPFGTHTIAVSEQDGALVAQSHVNLRAGMGPLTVYRLEQTCSETWSRGALASLTCNTVKDGRRTRVRAERQGGRLRVVGARGETFFPLAAIPSTWWMQPPSDATAVINTETGEALPVRVTQLGRETIEAGGARIEAQHIRVSGSLIADLWYDLNGHWVGCRFTTRGQRIEYRLTSPPAGAPA